MMPKVVHCLVLPLPPSPNDLPAHPMAKHRAKRRYQKRAWFEALKQEKPPRDPPPHVIVDAHFFVWGERDEDNLTSSLKFVWDALRQKQQIRGPNTLAWRQGLAPACGFFIDDNPRHLTLGEVTQTVDRNEQRLVLTLSVPDPSH